MLREQELEAALFPIGRMGSIGSHVTPSKAIGDILGVRWAVQNRGGVTGSASVAIMASDGVTVLASFGPIDILPSATATVILTVEWTVADLLVGTHALATNVWLSKYQTTGAPSTVTHSFNLVVVSTVAELYALADDGGTPPIPYPQIY